MKTLQAIYRRRMDAANRLANLSKVKKENLGGAADNDQLDLEVANSKEAAEYGIYEKMYTDYMSNSGPTQEAMEEWLKGKESQDDVDIFLEAKRLNGMNKGSPLLETDAGQDMANELRRKNLKNYAQLAFGKN